MKSHTSTHPRVLWYCHFVDFITLSFLFQTYLFLSHLFIESSLHFFLQELEMPLYSKFNLLMGPGFTGIYFVFSYFFNDGQSFGMFLFNQRLESEHGKNFKSFKYSFKWAMLSTLFCYSFGLSYFFHKTFWKRLRSHDFLYQDLLLFKHLKRKQSAQKSSEFFDKTYFNKEYFEMKDEFIMPSFFKSLIEESFVKERCVPEKTCPLLTDRSLTRPFFLIHYLSSENNSNWKTKTPWTEAVQRKKSA